MSGGESPLGISLYSPVGALRGIGDERTRAFAKIGIRCIRDLLYHFPRAYEHRGNVKFLRDAQDGEVCSFILTVSAEPSIKMIRRGMTVIKFRAFDESGTAQITFFNQTFIRDVFKTGSTFRFFGKMTREGRSCALSSPVYEPYTEGRPLPDLIPVYPLTDGLSRKIVEQAVSNALRLVSEQISDPLPQDIRLENNLCILKYAIENIHNPESFESLAVAGRRLVFDEYFTFSLGIALSASSRMRSSAPACPDNDLTGFTALLPFSLTGAQRRAVDDIRRDMTGNGKNAVRMSRIVVGDVGSGKTVCAAAAIYIAAKNGLQAALMAPTEILARQHYNDLSPLFDTLGIRCSLLVGSTKTAQKKKIYESLSCENHLIDVVIGTHALLEEGVRFSRLGLVVTDEQHRFGVTQRAALSGKGEDAHVLVMSATPIPRTLALIMYGDLDVSVIDELPPGRQKVSTFVVDESYRERLYAFIRKQVEDGGQVYIVCPAVEEREEDREVLSGEIGLFAEKEEENTLPYKAAVDYAQELSRDVFPDLKLSFLHGKMKSAEKERVMRDFSDGEINILVSTTVIEVGVNVPNASLMIVENAERFGLSQLHQLRGRVGRGMRKSYCILVSQAKGETARARLEAMRTIYDGYTIAEKDLALRGPGDFLAMNEGGSRIRQHGGMKFRLAGRSDDTELMKAAFESARALQKKDPELKLPEHEELKRTAQELMSINELTMN